MIIRQIPITLEVNIDYYRGRHFKSHLMITLYIFRTLKVNTCIECYRVLMIILHVFNLNVNNIDYYRVRPLMTTLPIQ